MKALFIFLALVFSEPSRLSAGIPAALGLLNLPVTSGMSRVSGGMARINLVEARWSAYSGADAEECRAEALRRGWKPAGEFFAGLPSPSGGITMTGYRRSGGSRMLLLVLPCSGRGSAVMALLDRPVNISGDGGEAPGREPAGIPRIASARRLLHLSGSNLEAAFYSSPARPSEVLASARNSLESRGWHAAWGGPGILLAGRDGGPDLAYFAREAPGGSRYLVFATGRNK